MSKGQELEDLSAKHHLPQKERNSKTFIYRGIKKSEKDAKCNRRRINIGEEFGRWTDLKNRFRLKTRAEVGTILLDR